MSQSQTYSFTIFDPARWWADGKPEPRWVYDNKVKTTNLTWDNIVSLLSTHIIEPVKQQTALFNGAHWKTLSDTTADIVEKNGKSYIRKTERNMLSTSLLILDYDDGTTIDDVIHNLKHITHCGYTSHSHSQSVDKFRVVIPLSTPIPATLLDPNGRTTILPALNKLFTNIDETSFDRARAFFFPSCPEETHSIAFTWHITGTLFDWTTLEQTVHTDPVPDYSHNTHDIVGLFKMAGLYQRKGSSGRHDALCPWRADHTRDVDSGFSIWDKEGFKCLHSHCKTRTLRDLTDCFISVFGEEVTAEYGFLSKKQYKIKKDIEAGKITKDTIKQKLMERLS